MSFIIYELEVVDGDLIIVEKFAWKLKFEKLNNIILVGTVLLILLSVILNFL